MSEQKYTHYKRIVVEKEGGVAVATMNRPEVLNAFDQQMHDEMERLFVDIGHDEDVRVLVLSGAGRAFSAGADLKNSRSFGDDTGYSVKRMLAAKKLVENILDLSVPFIAAVNGPSAGVATTVALMADIVYMADSAKLADTHVKIGLSAGDGGALIWPLLVGVHRAKEYLFTGDFVDGPTADRIGLVNRVVPLAELMPTALAMARRLAKGSPLAIQFTKAAINKNIRQQMNLILENSLGWEGLTTMTQDHKEAAAAFREKREPNFEGR